MRRVHLAGLATVTALALGISACGSEDHPNEDRPPAPIEMTAKVTDQKVTINPGNVGAGLANVTLANLSSDPVQLTFDGPTTASSSVVEPGSVGRMKLDLEEGDYSVGPGQESLAEAYELEVGPERPSSQNELLLP